MMIDEVQKIIKDADNKIKNYLKKYGFELYIEKDMFYRMMDLNRILTDVIY